VGVPGTARRPAEARRLPKVGGFTTFRSWTGSSSSSPTWFWRSPILQADIVRQLVQAGVPVLALNQRSLARDLPGNPS
jgi:hypothetical protein